MSTLLLRLSAPLQSWGADSKFERRMTQREPTKSGIVGLLAAALGRRRGENLEDLNALRFGVRIDQPGQMLRDYHIAQADKPYVTERYYLADAVFLVGLEGSEPFLRVLESAVNAPVFPLYLGRRSCPPVGKITLDIRDTPLEISLRNEEWQAGSWYRQKNKNNTRLIIVMDAEKPSAIRRRDVPISFNAAHRKYAFRNIDDRAYTAVNETEHNPLAALEEE